MNFSWQLLCDSRNSISRGPITYVRDGDTAQNPSAWGRGLEVAHSILSPQGCVLLVIEQAKK